MKFICALSLLCSMALCSFAQSGNSLPLLTVGAEVTLPVGTYADVYNTGFGASLKCEVPLSPDKVFFTVSAGYTRFNYKSDFKQANYILASGAGFVPLKAGFKYYPAGGLFFEGQGGLAISTLTNGGTAFAWSPGLGYSFVNGLETGLRYEAWSKNGTIGQVALKLAYRFKQ